MVLIRNKTVCYEMRAKGSFGNSIRHWKTLKELKDSNYQGPVVIRNTYSSGGVHKPCKDLQETIRVYKELIGTHWDPRDLMFNEGLDDLNLTLQGEALRGPPYGYWLCYSTLRVKMRVALKAAPRHLAGLQALNLLKGHMTESSFADFEAILELYPDHVVEFTCMNRFIGDLPGRNTIIWEVRYY